MAGPITTGNFAKLLWPGINSIFGKSYTEYPTEYTRLFEMHSSRMNFEEDLSITGLGLPSVKPEGQGITYDSERQGFVTRYTHLVYANGFIVTREAVEDDLYDIVGARKARNLAFGMRQGHEIVAANVYNRAFNSSYTGGDGVELLSTAHVNVSGGTWSNELTNAADLSEAALEQACIDIMGFTDDRGLKISVIPQTLLVPKELVFEAERILKTPYRVGSADNDINALYAMGKFPGGIVVNHYFTDTDAWFIRTNVKEGMKHFQRRPLEFAIDNDFDTENAKFKASERFSVGWSDPRGLFGSPGV
jgi:hypothetical protein